MEQFPVTHCIQCELIGRVRVFLGASLTQLHDHLRNVETAAADFLTASALQADILDLLRALLGYKEVRKDRADTACIYITAVNMTAQK